MKTDEEQVEILREMQGDLWAFADRKINAITWALDKIAARQNGESAETSHNTAKQKCLCVYERDDLAGGGVMFRRHGALDCEIHKGE